MLASEILGRAENHRFIFDQVWDRLWPKLAGVSTGEQVVNAFMEGACPYAQQFVPAQAGLILRVLRDRRFPKRREAQIKFLADSLAGLGSVTPRTSRDICEKGRAKQKQIGRAHV